MGDEETNLLLAALAHPTRMRIVRLLVLAGPEGLASGVIAERVGIPRNLMSSHLLILTKAGILRSERHGRNNVYGIVTARIEALSTRLRGIVAD